MPTIARACLFSIALLLAAPSIAQPAADVAALTRQVRELRDREEIRQLMIDYGRTIDARDFTGFGRLFARDGEYVSGPGTASVGPEKIGSGLAAVFAANPSNVAEPNFHVFFNDVIQVSGDTGTARSMAMFVAPGMDGKPSPLMLASYDDSFVREDGRWRFKRRAVRGRIPGPPAAK